MPFFLRSSFVEASKFILGSPLRTNSNYWRDQTWHLPIRERNKIYLLGSSDGHVPCRSVSVLYHVNWKMVKHSFPQIHREKSTGVLARDLLKDDKGSDIQTIPKPNRNEPDGEHSWHLVFIADGINWWRKHHRQKDGGRVEPINNWSCPNPRLNSLLGILRYLAHILCTFLLCHWEENFPQGGLLWQRILCF